MLAEMCKFKQPIKKAYLVLRADGLFASIVVAPRAEEFVFGALRQALLQLLRLAALLLLLSRLGHAIGRRSAQEKTTS